MPSGTLIAGFRVERVLRSTPEWIAYEATQLSLRRRVALFLHDDPVAAVRAEEGARRQALLHHPSILAVFETGRCPQGLFVARRLVPGGTLGQALVAGPPPESRLRRWLADVAAALEAAHRDGLVHGGLDAEAVLVQGERAFLSELAVPSDPAAEIAADRLAFAALVESCRIQAPPAPSVLLRRGWPRRRSRRLLLGAVGAVIAIAAAVVLVALGGRASPPPPVTAGATPVGSALAPGGDVAPRDCEGRPPGANSRSCTVVARDRAGRPLTAPADGVLRGWAVRGAHGGLAVQVVRRDAGGRYREVGRSQYERVADAAPRSFEAEVPVRRGDILALEIQPGAAVGVRGGGPGFLRWTGPLELVRAPRRPDAEPLPGGEMLVRYDLVPGASRREPAQLQGAAARAAPAGESIDAEAVELADGRVVTLSVVRVGGAIVLDLAHGSRRVARIEVPGADAGGRLHDLQQGFTRADYVRLEWRNPGGGPPLMHGYTVSAERLEIVH